MKKSMVALLSVLSGLALWAQPALAMVAVPVSQELPQTGEEIANTALIGGGILLVVVLIVVWLRRQKKN